MMQTPIREEERRTPINVRKYLKVKATIYLLFGLVIISLIPMKKNDDDIISVFFLGFMGCLLILGFILAMIALGNMDTPGKAFDPAKQTFQCKHCGEKFNDEKLKDRHEKSCAKMDISDLI